MSYSAFAATGDAKWWRFETNGMWIQICWEGLATNAAFNWTCWSSNNVLVGTPDVFVSTTTPGYGTDGLPTTQRRYLLGTKQLRGLAPNQNNNFVTQSGSDAITWCGATDYAYAAETNMLLTVKGGWYGANNAVAALAGTNIIQQGFFKCIGKIEQEYFTRATGPYQQRITGWNRHGQNNSPVPYAKCIAEDAHGHKYTNIVTKMDQALDFVFTIDPTGFTALDTITNHFEVGPWVGDSTSVISTVARQFDIQSPMFHWTETFYDPANAYGSIFSVVNPTNGVTHGTVLLTDIPDFSNPPTAFDTAGHAFTDMAATNLLVYGHNDTGNATAYGRGQNAWIGAGSPPATRGRTWSKFKAYPTDPQYSFAINSGTGNGKVDGFTIIEGADLTSADNSTFAGNQNLLFRNCRYNTANGALVDNNASTGVIFVDGAYVQNFGQGFSHIGSQLQTWALIKNVEINGPCPKIHPYAVSGIYKHSTNQTASFISTGQPGLPFYPDECVIKNFRLVNLNFNNSTFLSFFAGSQTCTNGFVLVQGEVENVMPYPAGQILDIHSDLATGFITNGCFGFIVLKGQRFGCLYNKEGSAPIWTVGCKEFGMMTEREASKQDTTATVDGGRYGGLAGHYGIGWSGNAFIQSFNSTEGGNQFFRYWPGVNTFQPTLTTLSPEGGTATPIGWAKFLNDGSSYDWVVTGTGNGNYRLHTYSPIANLKQEQIAPYDLDGFACGTFDGPGPHRGNQGCAAKAMAAF